MWMLKLRLKDIKIFIKVINQEKANVGTSDYIPYALSKYNILHIIYKYIIRKSCIIISVQYWNCLEGKKEFIMI